MRKLLTDIDKISSYKKPCVLAIGMFDGAHVGHRKVMSRAKSIAKKFGAEACVFTFSPHPSSVINMGRPPASLLFDGESRAEKFIREGIDRVFVKKFTKKFASLSPEEFSGFLMKKFPSLKGVVTGSNFVFGRGAEGNPKVLRSLSKKEGWKYSEVQGVEKLGSRVSSSRLREALRNGELEKFEILSGLPYSASGKTSAGKRLGRKIGFPTVNLPWNPHCKPPFGAYAAVLETLKGKMNGVANYGLSPTTDKKKHSPLLEINLFEPASIRAGTKVSISLKKFLRPERKFSSLDELKKQISLDKESAAEFFSKRAKRKKKSS